MAIQVRNLSHVYSKGLPFETEALQNISFDIYDNELIGIIGHTGSGKSTLLQILDGLLKPTSGSVKVGGEEITDKTDQARSIRKKIGLVFQYPEYQLFEQTVALDVAFGPKNLKLEKQEIDARVKAAIELVGLDYEAIKDRSPFELSGGQKRRVAIAGVIAMKPQVLILDEPTAGLDPKSHSDILEMIQKIHAAEKNITIFVSHNMKDIAQISDRVMVIDSGKQILMDTPQNVFAQRDRLKGVGLSVPPAVDLMYMLREKGIDINTNVLSEEEATDAIYEYLVRK